MTDIEVRTALPADLPQIEALIAERIGDNDAAEARIVLEDPEFEPWRWVVATIGDVVVSTAAWLDIDTRLGDVGLESGNLEFVATDPIHEGRGAARAAVAELMRRSEERGEDLQLVVGIPYFYRRFGFEYAVPAGIEHVVDRREVLPTPAAIREVATAADLQTWRDVQVGAARDVDFAVAHTAQTVRWMARSPEHRLWLGDDGRLAMREAMWGSIPYLVDVVAASPADVSSLVDALGPRQAVVLDRPATSLHAALEPFPSTPRVDAYYLRCPDPLRLLRRLIPVFDARLAASPYAEADADATVSRYVDSFRIEIVSGRVATITAGERVPAPISTGALGVPPDHLASLLFGPLGVIGLAGLHPDILIGGDVSLWATLFPPVTADVATWVTP